ncbi:MAG: hypothetical protein LC645_04135 [Geobacteraceae bacterium]|nr:hypothetical protein [Geobacteraceae bacterium]
MTQITRFNLLATALAGLMLALSISYFFIFLPYKEYSERTAILRQRYIAEEKRDLKLETQRAIDELEFLYRDYLDEIQTQLQMNVVGMKTFIEARQHESLSQIHTRVTQLRRELNQLPRMAHLIFDAQGELISYSKQPLREMGMAADRSGENLARYQPQ